MCVCVCVCVCVCNITNIAMLPHFNIYVGLCVKKGSWVAAKHTTKTIMDSWSIISTFSLIATFLLQKLKTELKNL